MNRTRRIAILGAIALVLAAGGTAVATRSPNAAPAPRPLAQDEEEARPSAEQLAHALDRLAANDLTVSEEQLAALAAEYGLGGAVRIVAWSGGDAATMDQIRAIRDGDDTEDGGMGWGQIAKELGVKPGIGWIMGSGGGNAPGQNKQRGSDD